VTDGYLWAPPAEPRAALVIDAQKRVRLEMLKEAPTDALQIIAGSHIILREGQTSVESASSFSRTRHPRTAVGIDADGKTLVLVVVDGRRPNQASGMSLVELAELMKQLGCRDAINLDGGGSCALVMRNPLDGKLHVINRPSDGRERPVANVLGLNIRGTRRTPVAATVPLQNADTNSK
jgi:exopolysaccharide biosynthesis protein